MIHVLIVDDHKLVRTGLKLLLATATGIKVVGECEDGDQVDKLLKRFHVDVILMDIQMKKMSGIEAAKKVANFYPKIKIIGLSMYTENSVVLRILKAGADGYLAKNCDKAELVKAIETVHAGGTFFGKHISDYSTLRKFMISDKEEITGYNGKIYLTDREKDVLRLIGKGMTNIQIGKELRISHRTAECHRNKILKKIGVKNSAELVKFAADKALLF